jgi:phosphatidylserine decarboxylase
MARAGFRNIRRLSIRWEQVSQARRIHHGLVRLCLAIVVIELSRLPIPSRRFRHWLFTDLYARMYPPGLNGEEAERTLSDYLSLNQLFTRGLKPESRPIPRGTPEVLSPCDGTIQDVGQVEQGKILTVKGIEYSLAELLASEDVHSYEGGWFAIIFLSPIDCHRVFSPLDGRLEELVHVPGARLLVHPPFQRPEFPVYTLNERVIFGLSAGEQSCKVVMVAGWGVGNITVPIVPGFRAGSKRVEFHALDSPPVVERASWMATFELGSTVVLVTSSSSETTPLVSPNEKVRYGQPLFRLGRPARAQ